MGAGSGFGPANLPFGVARIPGQRDPRVVVALGEDAVDLLVLHRHGLLDSQVDAAVLASPTLNPLLAQGPEVWRTARRAVGEVAGATASDLPAGALVPRSALALLVPLAVGDFVDGYGGLHHATSMGQILRPDAPALQPNWRHIPVAYHGRSGTVVGSGATIRRPRGHVLVDGTPQYRPTERLDFELELGYVVGTGSEPGSPVRADEADDHLFGVVLLNDWSARDVQAFEYQPLGPFAAKSFATSISHWVVTADALAPHLVAGWTARQDPAPAAHLRTCRPGIPDLHLEVLLQTEAMGRAGDPGVVVSRVDFAAAMYWSFAQQLAHATSNGAVVRPGDLFGSGTASGPDARRQGGSLMELTWGGAQPLELPGGEERRFLRDGDSIVLRGWCGDADGAPKIELGEVAGTVVPA
jgi:fumarylacetoacetase